VQAPPPEHLHEQLDANRRTRRRSRPAYPRPPRRSRRAAQVRLSLALALEWRSARLRRLLSPPRPLALTLALPMTLTLTCLRSSSSDGGHQPAVVISNGKLKMHVLPVGAIIQRLYVPDRLGLGLGVGVGLG
jgi:hypothetical protein